MSGLERKVERLERLAGTRARRGPTVDEMLPAGERLRAAAVARLAAAVDAACAGRALGAREEDAGRDADLRTMRVWCARHRMLWPVEGARERLAERVERMAARGA